MRPSQKQIAAITQHAMQPEQTTWPKTSAILWGLGTPNWELGILGWGWPPRNCSNRKIYVTFVSDAEQPKNAKEISCKSYGSRV